MLTRLHRIWKEYPGQFWLMFFGMLFSSTGASMIWPFMLIYVSGKLNLPLTNIASLITLNAISSVIASFLAGSIVDRFGRKSSMVVSLLVDGVLFLAFIRAETYLMFAILMILRGISNPLYRVGADAMLADLIEKEKRTEAYALVRMSHNAGISIGPALGGFLAATSYNFAFIGATVGMSIYGLLMGFFGRETLSTSTTDQSSSKSLLEGLAGYRKVLTDKPFISTISALSFGWVTATLMWIIMPVYANENFGIPENLYGLIPTTNAIMVVAFQVLTTRFTRNFRPLLVMAIGMLFYAIANGGVAFASNFWGFWICMVILTIGELIIAPTSSTYVANIAPAAMRGRYMSIFGLTWSFGAGIGPILGGLLNDNFGPRFIWVGGMTVGLISTIALLIIASRTIDSRVFKEKQPDTV